jgi:hypothetical protein
MNFHPKHLPFFYAAIITFLTVLIQSCDIKEPTAPNWDVSLNIPIANKSYTMLDIIGNESSQIQHYSGGTNQNLLYYSNVQQMDEITLGDKLKPDASSNTIPGTISISSDSIQTDIDLSWINPPVSPGMQIVLPAVPETNMSGNFSLADQFQTIKIASGFIDITITNYFPSPVKMTLRNIVLKNAGSGEVIVQLLGPIDILPMQSVTRTSIPIIQGISVKNQLRLESKISSTGSNGQQITLPAISLTIKAKFHDLKVSEYTGQLKPTVFEATRSAVGLDVKDIQKKLNFQQINLKNPKIELHLRLTANVEFSINGRVEARNSIGQRIIMTLSSRTLDKTLITQADSVVTFNADSVSNFFRNFSQPPDSLIVYIGGIANPNNKTISVTGSDQLIVSSKMEFPLEFGLSGGEFYDSVKVDFKNDDRDKIKDVNSLGASVIITNGIPASLSFTAKLYDQSNNFLTYFPPKYQDQDTVISVNGAGVDANGNVISNTIQNVTVKTLKSEIDKISKAYYMRIKVRFNTSGLGSQAVKFKTDNFIKFLASGSTNYHINPKGN